MAGNKAATAISKLSIDVANEGAVINKNIYGQFAEHLGRCIYDGLWVGPDSSIPNTRGWRNDLIAALREIQVPVVRWPGGCFADQYHWRDGIGPRDQRPMRVNTLWGRVEEPNAVGTHEYFDLIELLGADAYVSGNIGTGTPQEMADWLEYLTADSNSELAELRRKNGRDEPWEVQFWGVGNECWGCGGHMEPQYYTDLYKHWGTFLRTPWDKRPKFVASGGHGGADIGAEGEAAGEGKDATRWTEYLSANIKADFLLGFDAISFHYYTHPYGDVFTEKGNVADFPEEQWASTLVNTLKMDGYIKANKEILERNNPQNTVSFYVDEWGTWYDTPPDANAAFLYQQNTLRDAVVAALNFNVFHAHADRVGMTNIAQVANVLQSMVLTEGEQLVKTPTYHVYKMYVPFQNATALSIQLDGDVMYQHGEHCLPAISASAARGSDGKLYLALVNVDPQQQHDISVSVPGLELSAATGQVLTAADMDAHNTFAKPALLEPIDYMAEANADGLVLRLPPKSVLVLGLQ